MKRIEMFHIIVDLINKHTVNYPLGEQVDKYMADDILNTIEREGMMPPFTYDIFLQEFHKYGIGAANGHKWEPEDD